MDHTLPSRILAAQHHQIDRRTRQIAGGSHDTRLLRDTSAQLRLHLYVEEEIVFPAIATSALEMPLYIMKYEHGQMWGFLESISAAGGESVAESAAHEDSRKLVELFQRHNPKEEDLIYAAADRAATEGTQQKLTADIKAAQVPDGWLCMAKREDFAPPPGAPAWRPAPLPR